MASARWPADPPFEVPKLIKSSRSYGSSRRTSATFWRLAGTGPPGVAKSAAPAFATRTNAAAMHQESSRLMPGSRQNDSHVVRTGQFLRALHGGLEHRAVDDRRVVSAR